MNKEYSKFLDELEATIKAKKLLSDEQAIDIIETVLDALIEVGNGVSDKQLHECADLLFTFRDLWLKTILPTKDDPLLDNTDFAHPAFWRGQLSGVHGACKSIENILDGKDDGSGVVNDERLEKLRRRLLDFNWNRLLDFVNNDPYRWMLTFNGTSEITLEYFDSTYYGDLESFCGTWSTTGDLEKVLQEAISFIKQYKIDKLIEEGD